MCYLLTQNPKVQTYLSSLDVFAVLISGLCYCISHTGFTNAFEIASFSGLALTYNNISVSLRLLSLWRTHRRPGFSSCLRITSTTSSSHWTGVNLEHWSRMWCITSSAPARANISRCYKISSSGLCSPKTKQPVNRTAWQRWWLCVRAILQGRANNLKCPRRLNM